jgi:hypothetical protein
LVQIRTTSLLDPQPHLVVLEEDALDASQCCEAALAVRTLCYVPPHEELPPRSGGPVERR